MVLDLRPGFPAKTLEEFTAYAKTHSLTSGSAGVGSISHLTYLLYVKLTGTHIQHVPYRGLSEAMNGLLMFGVSTAMVFAVIQRLIETRFPDLRS